MEKSFDYAGTNLNPRYAEVTEKRSIRFGWV